jgi:capsular polysaccharide biosynthesis protein
VTTAERLKTRLERVPRIRKAVTAAWNTPALRASWLAMQRWRTERIQLVDDLKREAAERGWPYTTAAGDVIQTSRPSLTIPEEIVDLLNHGSDMLSSHARAGQHDAETMQRLWFGQLLSVFRYPVFETFTCEIPDAIVGVPNGEVLSSDLRGYTQSSRLEWDTVIVDRVPPPSARIPGLVVPLMGWSGNDYGHWVIDILLRVALAFDRLPECTFLVPEQLPNFKLESLRLLGIADSQLLRVPKGWHRVERALVCHHAQRYMIAKQAHLFAFRRRVHEAVFEGAVPPASRRVYVSRNKSRRKIVNEEEIMPVLTEYGFERMYCEDLSFRDQVRLFAETSHLIGAHGAGLNNDVLCQSGAVVIELLNPVRWNYCIRGVANTMGHTHWFLSGKNASPDWDMTVDPNRLAKLLAAVFEAPSGLETVY